MKRRLMLGMVPVLLLAVTVASAQLKSQLAQESRISEGLIKQSESSLFLGWFDPSKFEMHHMFELSYQSIGGQGMSLGTYTNSMSYQFADNLNARADVSMSYSPYNTFSSFGGKKNDLSAIYLSRAELNYRPWDNVMVQFQYRQLPYGSYYASPFYDPWYRGNGF
jgi:hypothetical protein